MGCPMIGIRAETDPSFWQNIGYWTNKKGIPGFPLPPLLLRVFPLPLAWIGGCRFSFLAGAKDGDLTGGMTSNDP